MKTAIIYCRVSSDKQAQQWDSLANQEKDCRSYCERMHIDVVEVFREQFTGTSIQRPALGEAMKFLKKHTGKIDYCIVHKIDRSTRGGLWDYYEIKKQIESSGTTLKDTYWVIGDDINVVHVDNLDTSEYDWATFNPSEMAVSMMVLQAQQERAGILRRTIPQEMRNTQNWYISRQAHFGYQNQKICTPEWKLKVIYTPHPIESQWIQMMFDLRASGSYSDMQIVDRLNLMWYKSRSIKKWDKSKTTILW
jgi:DNA invertase Pin-like site-specific DNA recombinase